VAADDVSAVAAADVSFANASDRAHAVLHYRE
jgi:hypothetical protein